MKGSLDYGASKLLTHRKGVGIMSFGLIINHNLGSMSALSALNSNQDGLQKMLKQLSTGKQINSAADNAAGYAISQKMQSQINGLGQAAQNSQDGISLLQTASGALNETQSILQRMRTLAVQSANDTNTTQDRSNLQAEVNQLVQQINTISSTTQFNTKDLLNGGAGIQGTVTDTTNAASSGLLSIVNGSSGVTAGTTATLTNVTAATGSSLTFSSGSTTDGVKVANAATLSLNGVSVSLTAGMTGSQVASAINAVSGQSGVSATYGTNASTGDYQLVLSGSGVGTASEFKVSGINVTGTPGSDTFNTTNTTATSVTASDSGSTNVSTMASATTYDIQGTNASATVTSSTGATVTTTAQGDQLTLHGTGTGVDGLQLQVASNFNAPSTDQFQVAITANNALNLQIGANEGQNMSVSIGDMSAASLGVNNIDITSSTSASSAISTIDTALATVSTQQANLGAYQNRLQDSIRNVDTASQNLTTAQAGITDTNMASAMANFTKDNVLQQAAISMLAQANQQPQLVLKLLG